MSDVAARSRIAVFLADYAAVDGAGKLNALGAGWAVSGTDPVTGHTSPQCVVVMIDSPPDLYGEDFDLTLTLRDSAGEPVMLPGPAGEPQAMRVAQTMRVEEPIFAPAMNVPRHVIWGHSQLVLNLAAGIPIAVGASYTWTLEIDGQSDERWAASFHVPGPRPGPVFGGPANPANIPELGDPSQA